LWISIKPEAVNGSGPDLNHYEGTGSPVKNSLASHVLPDTDPSSEDIDGGVPVPSYSLALARRDRVPEGELLSFARVTWHRPIKRGHRRSGSGPEKSSGSPGSGELERGPVLRPYRRGAVRPHLEPLHDRTRHRVGARDVAGTYDAVLRRAARRVTCDILNRWA
jgi:hypothetical protein